MFIERLIETLRGGAEPPKPFYVKRRWPCPFLSFHLVGDDVFCGGDGDSYCPLHGHTCLIRDCPSGPNWNECPFNREENKVAIDNLLRGTRIVPYEFWPPGEKRWKGMPTIRFAEYVMSPKAPRPVPMKMSETTTASVEND